MRVHCESCGCKSEYKEFAQIQQPPDPACNCHCHEVYWQVHGTQFREEVASGKKAVTEGASASLRLLRG